MDKFLRGGTGWNINDEREFISMLGIWSEQGRAVGQAELLRRYLRALDIPSTVWSEQETAALREWTREGIQTEEGVRHSLNIAPVPPHPSQEAVKAIRPMSSKGKGWRRAL